MEVKKKRNPDISKPVSSKMSKDEYLMNKDRLKEFAEVYKSGDLNSKLKELSASRFC